MEYGMKDYVYFCFVFTEELGTCGFVYIFNQ